MSLPINASNAAIRNVLVKFGQGAFFAHHVAAMNVATATTVKLLADTEIVDVCGWFADSVFTPKVAGYYLLLGSVFVTSDADWDAGTFMSVFIRKNGATPAYISRTALVGATDIRTVAGTINSFVILEANGTTDYFDFAAVHTDGSTISVSDISFGGVFVSYNNP